MKQRPNSVLIRLKSGEPTFKLSVPFKQKTVLIVDGSNCRALRRFSDGFIVQNKHRNIHEKMIYHTKHIHMVLCINVNKQNETKNVYYTKYNNVNIDSISPHLSSIV